MIRRLGPRGALAAWVVVVGLLIALVIGSLWWVFARIQAPSQPSPSYATFAVTYYDNSHSRVIHGVMSAHDGSIIWDKPMFTNPGNTAVADGVYYTSGTINGATQSVVAFRMSDGAEQASYTPPGSPNVRPLVVTHGLLLFAAAGDYPAYTMGTIFALDVAKQTLVWSANVPGADLLYAGMYPQIAMNDTTLFVISLNSTLHQYATVTAVRLSDGVTRWSRTVNSASSGVSTTKEGSRWLAAGPDGVYFADTRGAVTALRPSDGATLWSTQPLATSDISATVTYGGSSLYVCQSSDVNTHPLVALDPATGATRWRASLPTCGGQLVETGGVLYAAANNLIALRASDGAVLWDVSPLAGDEGYRSLQVADGVVVTAASMIGGTPPTCSINVLQGRTSSCQSTGYVAAFNGANGTIYWRKDINANPFIISDERFISVSPGYLP
jgi:outer membrane protein assembly factor BamB